MAPSGEEKLLSLSSQPCTNVHLFCRMALIAVGTAVEEHIHDGAISVTAPLCFCVPSREIPKQGESTAKWLSGKAPSNSMIQGYKLCVHMCTCVWRLQISRSCVCVPAHAQFCICTRACTHALHKHVDMGVCAPTYSRTRVHSIKA